MGLVSAKEISKVIKLDKYGFLGTFVGWLFLKITRISTINKFYSKNKHLSDVTFLNAIVDEFDLKFEIPESDLKRLPKTGAYITVSNHPLGGVDGILLLKLLLEREPNFKIIANFLLHRIEPLKPYIMPVNPFENHKDAKSSLAGVKDALRHLSDGKPLGIFPSGEVSTYKEGKLVVDKPWEEGAIKLIKKANVPVVPIYFHAHNSKLFYFLSKINDVFRTAKLPSEVLSQKNRTIKVRIGKPIPVKEQAEYQSLEEYSKFLRKKTYMLAKAFENTEEINPTVKSPKPKVIVKAANLENMIAEVENLRNKECRVLQSKYYGHLFLWDLEANKVAGAYRIGLGKEIFAKYGIEGFYLNDLFRFEPELYDMMSMTFDLGRAFVVKEYQQRPMPLFLLWRGVVHVTLRYPEMKYLMGGVSISNQFSDFSKSLMIEFMKSNYYDPYVAQYIHPKKEYKVTLKDADKDFVFNESEADLDKFDKIIDELEPGNLRLPVLIKKYIKQSARVVAFNVDPMFNNATDGLFYIRIADLPEDTVRPVMEEFQAELERKSNEKS